MPRTDPQCTQPTPGQLALRRKPGLEGSSLVNLAFETGEAIYRTSTKAHLLPKGKQVAPSRSAPTKAPQLPT